MAGIQVIRLKGFQSHIDSSVELSPGLTVITGPSDSGKTAVIRAVRWVAFGEPTGEAFVNEAVGEAEVTIELSNGVAVTKHRRKGKTSYRLNTMEQAFEKAELPVEVEEALQIVKQRFGDFETALNFAYQLEAPFLISETASAGAKILGKLAGTERLDLAAKAIAKDTYAARQERSHAEKDIERINQQLGAFIGLDKLREQLDACEYLVSDIEKVINRQQVLRQLTIQLAAANTALAEYADQLDKLAAVPSLVKDLENIEKAQQRYDTLLGLYGKLGEASAQIERLEKYARQFHGLQEADTKLCSLESNRVEKLTTLSTVYTRYTQEVNTADNQLRLLAGVDQAVTILAQVEQAQEKAARLDLLQNTYENETLVLEACNRRLAKSEGLEEAAKLLAGMDDTLARIARLKELRQSKISRDLVVAQANVNLNNTETGLRAAEAELAAAWEAAGGICPLCDQPHTGGGC
ncbi:AAA family ATPase [Brevibacillus fulvus]|uniref:Nuclease SbcCD subunit C n=1 Tax=Brevibacillus fulvus TaxID=1125967 RepID=A0A938XW15_9BACL|nr:AAA family ATPase [Brevibacillus fulvus]MBM7591202.1 exonuclease SbcC [Brevibacillus fulvus]